MVDLINSKMFLGQEFLTWLWYLSEEQGSVVLADGREVTVYLEDLLVLGPQQGNEGSRVTVRGHEGSLAEAREGLKQGKLVDKMRLGMLMGGEEEHLLTLQAAELGISSLKLPAAQPGDAEEDPDALRLERIYLVDQAVGVIDELFGIFLRGRLENEQGGELWAAVRAWANSDKKV